MAEYLFKDKIKSDGNWQITSAGTYTREGLPSPPEVQTVLKDYGIDTRAHRTKEVNRSLIEKHNLVLCLASNHKEALQFEFSDLADRIYLLSEMVGQEVSVEDPIGGPLVEFEAAAREIDAFLSEGLEKIVELASERKKHGTSRT
jgi:protein-tyrosine-phosphatase